MSSKSMRAADHLTEQLIAQGAQHIFGVPGESYLAVLDAIYARSDALKFVTCRQEGGAAMAAEAYGKLTGRPGICMVTRGPGATNASAGVHVAFQDSTPMILFIGQVARPMIEREAFQEIDYRRMFGQMAKWVAQIDDASRIQEYISRAYRIAMSGRPGPVVLALPEDMLVEDSVVLSAPSYIDAPCYQPVAEMMDTFKTRLSNAQKPLVIAGGGGWTNRGIKALEQFAEKQNIPIAVSFRCQSLINNDHKNYVGHFSVAKTAYLADAIEKADLLIAIGPRLGEITTCGYTLMQSPKPRQKLVHVFPSGEEIGRVFEPDIALVSDTQSFCEAVADWKPIAPSRFADRTENLRKAYENFSNPASVKDDPLAPYFAHMADVLADDAIVTNGAGNYAAWLQRFYRYRGPNAQLAPTSGSMGYGLPAAIAAASCYPKREVFAIAGDGCFMMSCQELATAVQHALNLTVIIIDNKRYGTIRAHQERAYPNRVSGTDMVNPDFCALAVSFGAKAQFVSDFGTFKKALSKSRKHKGLFVIHVEQGQDYLAPGKLLS